MIDSVSSASFASLRFQQDEPRNRSGGPFSADPRQSEANAHPFIPPDDKANKKGPGQKALSDDEKRQVQELKQRDAAVRAHEQAHLAAAAGLSMGGPNYVYQTGPDGKQYAIGGDVKIDTSPGRTPEETARKASQIRAAALAPSDPSPQDLKVAAAAASMAQQAEQKADKEEPEPGSPDSQPQSPSGEITSSRQLAATAFPANTP